MRGAEPLRIDGKYLLVAVILTLCVGCTGHPAAPKENDLLRMQAGNGKSSKKVIFILVDSLMHRSIDLGIKQKKLPTFQYLIDHGQYYNDLVSSFPTMSVTIDSTLLTGTHPDEHRIPGLIWLSSKEGKMINYGTGPAEIMKQGVGPVLRDALFHLNENHLSPGVETIFERLHRAGITSGSINGLIYRGKVPHALSFPRWIAGAASLPAEHRVKGPDFLAFGAFSNPFEGRTNLTDRLTKRFGFNNDYAVEAVTELIRSDKLPDFLFVYMPDMDRTIHRRGPSDLEGVQSVDRQLGALLQAFGSKEKALEKSVIVVAGDSGMSQLLPAAEQPVVDLTAILDEYSVLAPGQPAGAGAEIALAVNETMAYVYKLSAGDSLRDIAGRLNEEARIDFTAWKEDGWIQVMQAGADGRSFRYHPGGGYKDRYGQKWTVEGDAAALDVRLNEREPSLAYGNYPDALRRLFGALHSHEGEYLVVAAKEGYELSGQSSPTHKGGGGHGAMNRTESLVPLLIGGTKEKPSSMRIVDLKDYVLKLLLP
ncbi:alkaline phosphatase family protein [Paenibacillus arenilitoris]|uniref:Alkaline phosphatase family protein n=1 Tax=Paenibacillus arenilitoris TaxID=2772299 RepID=A0A927CSK9_9BACL|nr:alkaline phosphatase family protein [Paenibacillus arenilitoris]MBD2871121.1 alkaline phosphatase family protein [Paenibacillus arenilitoris]